ncbi:MULTISPECIES: hypothetical protein [unclassified Peribacillus]|uniref:hypothetical protein n=1 Tax=unclassified Peribacillus TaxID=2675266 RepID=UPI001913171B|nr:MULTISPECIES: hypothetical protein [unclassified Peribacillus]MBK5441544.1 hypothetical protein [Peribacillus sp. TH24]MBK5458524.1 hypothetical protein [Peribacillus sp. TH27]MBK5480423.1 hypothetical protein [Peribacillus sp. TH16]MBK5501937.1 hypothetical protein [Peribacillus sp. TH14]WMX58138.1 hypothetical protein RE409_13450 [Peribacillus sp. R9-11]
MKIKGISSTEFMGNWSRYHLNPFIRKQISEYYETTHRRKTPQPSGTEMIVKFFCLGLGLFLYFMEM